jgi:hypothetical protein
MLEFFKFCLQFALHRFGLAPRRVSLRFSLASRRVGFGRVSRSFGFGRVSCSVGFGRGRLLGFSELVFLSSKLSSAQ